MSGFPDEGLTKFKAEFALIRVQASPPFNRYWDPRESQWVTREPGKYVVSDVGIPPPPVGTFEYPEVAFPAVQTSWTQI
jgi:hypothetical protein